MKKKSQIFGVLAAGILITASSLLGVYWINTILRQSAEQHFRTNQEQSLNILANEIEGQVAEAQKEMELISYYPTVQTPAKAPDCIEDLKSILSRVSNKFTNIGRVDKNGFFTCSVNAAIIGEDSRKYGSYVAEIINDPEHKPRGSRAIFVSGNPDPVIGLHVPVYVNGVFDGTVGGAISLKELREKYLQDVQIGYSGYVSLLDNNGDILFHPDQSLISKNLGSEELASRFSPRETIIELTNDIKAGGSGDSAYQLDNKARFTNYKSFEAVDRTWTLFTTLPDSDVNLATRENGLDIAFYLALGLALMVSIVFLTVSLLAIKRSEELQRAKDDFINMASHQLRTPSSGVKAVLSMVLAGDYGKLDPKQHEVISKAYAANEEQLELISGLLNVARIEANRAKLELSQEDIVELVNSAVVTSKNVANEKQQTLTVTAESLHKKVLELDREKVGMVVSNLVSNAVKYTPNSGKIEVIISQDDKNTYIKVKDNGMGISKEDLSHLFDRFYRSAEVKTITGTGLGLHIAKNLISMHKGTIKVESTKGSGSVFTIILPINETPSPNN